MDEPRKPSNSSPASTRLIRFLRITLGIGLVTILSLFSVLIVVFPFIPAKEAKPEWKIMIPALLIFLLSIVATFRILIFRPEPRESEAHVDPDLKESLFRSLLRSLLRFIKRRERL